MLDEPRTDGARCEARERRRDECQQEIEERDACGHAQRELDAVGTGAPQTKHEERDRRVDDRCGRYERSEPKLRGRAAARHSRTSTLVIAIFALVGAPAALVASSSWTQK